MARFHSPAQSISPSPSVSSTGSGASWSRSYSPASSTTSRSSPLSIAVFRAFSPASSTTSISSSWSTITAPDDNPSNPNKNGYKIPGLRLGPQQPLVSEARPAVIRNSIEEFGVRRCTSDNKRKRGSATRDEKDESQRK
ncbi:hypothetical protein CVT24_010734, partial [Panaeolus cyanescens]